MDESQNRVAASVRRQLKQDRVWIDKTGVPHDLNSISPEHRANLIPYLRAWAHNLYPDVSQTEAKEILEATPMMRRLTAEERGQPIESRAAVAAHNYEYEAETGYRKVRPE